MAGKAIKFSEEARANTLKGVNTLADAVKITGNVKGYSDRYFCPDCGSPVFARSGAEVEVHLGCLDAPDQFIPTYECWTKRREAWLPEFTGMTRYDQDRRAEETEP